MKKALSFIRWKFVVPVGLFIAALVVFFVVFLDPLLTKGLEMAGAKVNGAKVNVTSLRTKIFSGQIRIGRLQVADKAQPMKNTVDVGPLTFQLVLPELLKKRVIIPEAAVEGLKFNTDRATSGALPVKKKESEEKKKDEGPSAVSKLTEKYGGQFKLKFDGMKTDVKSKIDFNPKETQVFIQGEALKQKSATLPNAWQEKMQSLNVDARLKQVDADIKTIRATPTSGVDALKAVPASLKKLKEVKEELGRLQSDVKKTKTDLGSDIQSLRSDLKNLENAKKKDLDDILSRLNLDFFSPKKLVDGLIGGTILAKVQTALHYVQMARTYMPSKKESESLPPRPRIKGVDIAFPTMAAPPAFWLKLASLSGSFQDATASGRITDLNTDPSRVGKPTRMDFSGNKGSNAFTGNIIFDHVTDVKKDGLSLEAKGFQVKDLGGGSGLAAALTGGTGQADFALSAIGEDQIGGNLKAVMTGVKVDAAALLKEVGLETPGTTGLSAQDKIKVDLMANIAKAIEKMPSVTIEAKLSGTWSNPDLSFSSNLDNEFSRVIKETVGGVVDSQKKEVEAKLNQLMKEKSGDVEKQIAALQSKLTDQFSGPEKNIQDKIKEAAGVNLSSGDNSPIPGVKLPSLDKLFKR